MLLELSLVLFNASTGGVKPKAKPKSKGRDYSKVGPIQKKREDAAYQRARKKAHRDLGLPRYTGGTGKGYKDKKGK